MKQTTRLIVTLTAALLCLIQTQAQTIHRKKDVERPDSIEKVIVQGDTVDIIIPQANYGRFDRALQLSFHSKRQMELRYIGFVWRTSDTGYRSIVDAAKY